MPHSFHFLWQAFPLPLYVFHPTEYWEPASAASVFWSRVTFLSKVLMARQRFGRIPYCIEEFSPLWLVVEDQKSVMDLMRPVDCENSSISRKVLQHKKWKILNCNKQCIYYFSMRFDSDTVFKKSWVLSDRKGFLFNCASSCSFQLTV